MAPNIKVLKNPGFLYDLNYLFYAHFNPQACVDEVADETKREAYAKYLKETLKRFGDISDDLYVFYHALEGERCFMTTCYMDPYKDYFTTDFDFKYFKGLLSDNDRLVRNLIQFYFYELSEEELDLCCSSCYDLFSRIKGSKYSGEEKSKLYEFFLDPVPYIQALQYELMEKEILLSNYYKDNYGKIIELHNDTKFEMLCKPITVEKDLSFLNGDDQILYISYCLFNKFFMKYLFVKQGMVYLLGFDYVSVIESIAKSKKTRPLEELCGALSETSRVQILELLLEKKELTCKDLERIFNFSGSTAYHHITLLARIGAVKIRNEGKVIYYSLNKKHFDMMTNLLKKFSNN